MVLLAVATMALATLALVGHSGLRGGGEATVGSAVELASFSEEVKLDNEVVFGGSAGDKDLNGCMDLPPGKRSISVKGTNTKVTLYMLRRCKDYTGHSHQVGSCDASRHPDHVEQVNFGDHGWLQNAQSYQIEQC
ncbi:unnamed protein product [Symbiodinium natans]|uniref:Uncharacterized protein n=1 Tax=Symbiodinium natans TaxID=878477 RepID=A0A812NNU1_9DINO|nr:unnamed protein product [Symbiodinium natans]